MDNKARGIVIRGQILREVKNHPSDITKHIAKHFSITPQAVNSHIKRLEKGELISSTGIGKGKKYYLGDVRECITYFRLEDGFAENDVWRENYSFIFENLAENIIDICHYGFTEIVNNVIDHSAGKGVHISVRRNKNNIEIMVIDDGEGIYKRIKRLCKLADERQALLELSKGKLTTDPANHSGEGIFFTSRVFDKFVIESKGLEFSHDHEVEFDFLSDSSIPKDQVGTLVFMVIRRNSKRILQGVFDEYTAGPEDFQFNRTVIPVRLAQYGNEKLVSRSQAKRILIRIENFKYVIFDFSEVSFIGQAFADEIFRVYAHRHPEIILTPVNMEEDVTKMIKRALLSLEAQ